jgi:hypothetical protein
MEMEKQPSMSIFHAKSVDMENGKSWKPLQTLAETRMKNYCKITVDTTSNI